MSVVRIARTLREAAEKETKGGVGGDFAAFLKEVGDQKVKNPDTGNMVKVKSLKGPKGKELVKKEFEKWKKSQDKKDKGKGKEDSKGSDDDYIIDINDPEAVKEIQDDLKKAIKNRKGELKARFADDFFVKRGIANFDSLKDVEKKAIKKIEKGDNDFESMKDFDEFFEGIDKLMDRWGDAKTSNQMKQTKKYMRMFTEDYIEVKRALKAADAL